ncbi:hypothetical protein TcasGA2_TC006647 [Tribolium castaneum]|uniref:Uncharacterized protein n=1 Tax=Tribolium castaneum TaxID=7070 RepID=D6WY33_TRICA|nr:PREDICTED: uncharacterized protein LOC107398541 [Tribolium castaneum]EFA08940.1 hypothetical protein TcasGA2_TC006647 [Tribolium castaneum]|eukprot:XP_015838388.1 PREDICTED: uncharacterized protein LOC107398541 [Tribolium castaneum]
MNTCTIIFLVISAHNCNSLIREETDLRPLSNYETVGSENFENWEGDPDDANIVTLDKVAAESTLEEICKNSKNFVYLKQEDVIIDCQDFKNDEPEKTERIYKRSVDGDALEGSGDSENATEIQEKSETTTPLEENVTTSEKNENTTIKPEETENTTTETPEPENTTPFPETTAETTEKPKEQPETPENSDKWVPKNDVEVIKGKTLIGDKLQEATDQKSDESEKVGESSKTPQKAGSKDTTILIGLFVAVIVVGGLAYGYNVIKKRKQRSADLERVERAPSIKRSLNNLTKPDGEPEKKPLIGEKKEVEMVDMKKENSTQETPEKAPSDNETL